MVGALTEDYLRCLLTESGEMRRWQEAERVEHLKKTRGSISAR
jgi:hypothetical protein